MTHPKVKAFEALLHAHKKQKSTFHVFLKWVDVARAFRVCAGTVRHWKNLWGWQLPITRMKIERDLWSRNLLTSERNSGKLIRVLEWRLGRRKTRKDICKCLRVSQREFSRQWREAMEQYEMLQPQCQERFNLPPTVEEAWALYKQILAKRNRRSANKRRAHELKPTESN